jgi:hypothetical protein
MEGIMEVKIEMAGSDRLMFHPLLREGVEVKVRLGGTVREILRDDLHIPEQIIDQEIQSLFLNNHPVDDLETRIQTQGSVLSLSAAMPGLVGACMRRGGAYAGLRQGISWAEEEEEPDRTDMGFIRVKLFNFLAPRIGPLLLSRGVRVEGRRLGQVLDNLSEAEKDRVKSLQVGSEKHDIQSSKPAALLSEQDSVMLQVFS